MMQFTRDLVVFYQTNTVFKLFSAVVMMIFPLILIIISLREKTKRARGHFPKQALRRYHLAQARWVLAFLVFGSLSHYIAYPAWYKGSGIVIPIWIGLINLAFSLVAFCCLIIMEMGIAAAVYSSVNFSLMALLHNHIDNQSLSGICVGVWFLTILFIMLCYSIIGDALAQKYLNIKYTSSLEETAA